MFHCLSLPDSRVDAVAGVAYWFGNVKLWEITVARCSGIVRTSRDVAAITTFEPRAATVVWGWKMDPFRDAHWV